MLSATRSSSSALKTCRDCPIERELRLIGKKLDQSMVYLFSVAKLPCYNKGVRQLCNGNDYEGSSLIAPLNSWIAFSKLPW